MSLFRRSQSTAPVQAAPRLDLSRSTPNTPPEVKVLQARTKPRDPQSVPQGASQNWATVPTRPSSLARPSDPAMYSRAIPEPAKASTSMNASPARVNPAIANPSSVTPDTASPDTRKRLFVGAGISVCGEIGPCDELVVEGRIEADVLDCQKLIVAREGVFQGSARIQDADVSGQFLGKITASERLTVRGTGLVSGDVAYRELTVEAGGRIKGSVDDMSAPEAETTEPEAETTEPEAETGGQEAETAKSDPAPKAKPAKA